ncbi:MAG TPA: cytochrome c [Blastocatellia bacterium]|jgi:mono/diheme cytochrome c family protein|nr:cytochrome c [Blastocatellia bacterium]
MKTLKMGLIILLAAAFSAACSPAETANQNAGRSAAALPAANANATANNAGAEKPASDARPVSNANAAQLYTANACAGCHGTDGKGVVKDAPDFTNAAWQKRESDPHLVEDIKKGKLPKMPAYGDKLKDEEIKALVAHIRTFAK